MIELKKKEKPLERSGSRTMLVCGGILMLLLAYFSWTTVYSSDDYWYSTFWDNGLGRYLELMDYHYERFNGRVLVHVLAHIVLHFDRWAFVLMCCGLCAAAAWAAGSGGNHVREQRSAVHCCFLIGMLCMPLDIFNQGVTWISAACNYLFPAVLACLMAVSLERRSNWCFLLAFLCGATTEQMGLAAVVMAAVYAIYDLLCRRGVRQGLLSVGLAVLGVVTIFLSPATANRADARVRMDNLEVILNTFRKAILREANYLTDNPAPVLLMLAILVLGAVILWREKAWKWPVLPAGLGAVLLVVGALGDADAIRIAGFIAAFLMLAVMAVLLMVVGRSYAGVITLTGLAAAAVMLPTNTVEPRVMLPVYLLLLVSACVLAGELLIRPALPVLGGTVLAVAVSVPAIMGYWHNYQIDLQNERFARDDREKGTIRYCVDYDQTYTWIKADYDHYFRMKYMESIGLPEETPAQFFSWSDNPASIECAGMKLLRNPWNADDGTLMLPLREITETLGGSLEWTPEHRIVILDGFCLELIPLDGSRFLIRSVDQEKGPAEFEVMWKLKSGDTYIDALFFEQGFGLSVREEPDKGLVIVNK